MTKVFLKSTDIRHKVTNSDTTVFGAKEYQSIVIDGTAKRVVLDANIETVQFSNPISDYKFKQVGNRLEIYDNTGLVSRMGLQDDENGTQLTFANGGAAGTFDAKFTPISIEVPASTIDSNFPTVTKISVGITVGGTVVSSNSASTLIPVDAATAISPFPPSIDPTVDLRPPTVYPSADVSENGKAITLTFDEALSKTSATPSMFGIRVEGVKMAVSNIEVGDNSLVLTPEKVISANQHIVVDYMAPITLNSENTNFAVQDLAGNDSESFSIGAINRSATDSQAPAFLTAEVSTNGTNIILKYDEKLSAIKPEVTAYTVKAGVMANDLITAAVTAVDIADNTVTLTLNKPLTYDQKIVTLNYNVTIDDSLAYNAAIQDEGGNDSAALVNKSATNNSSIPPDSTSPILLSSEVREDGKAIVLTFDEALNIKSADASTLSISINGAKAISPTAVTVDNSTVILSLAKNITNKDIATVSYNAPAVSALKTNAAIQDFLGNDAGKFSAVSVINHSAIPTFTIKPDANQTIVEGKSLVFTVTKASPAISDTTLIWTKSDTVNDSNLTTSDINRSGSLKILAGKTTGTFTLTAVNDFVPENPETFALSLLSMNKNGDYDPVPVAITGVITITDAPSV
jgi:uncharacterized repeat protein (TIGR02059 family)